MNTHVLAQAATSGPEQGLGGAVLTIVVVGLVVVWAFLTWTVRPDDHDMFYEVTRRDLDEGLTWLFDDDFTRMDAGLGSTDHPQFYDQTNDDAA